MKPKNVPQIPPYHQKFVVYFQYFNFFIICLATKESWSTVSFRPEEQRKEEKSEGGGKKSLLEIQTWWKYYRVHMPRP